MSAIPLLPAASAAAGAAPAIELSQMSPAVSVATAALRSRQTDWDSLRCQDGSDFDGCNLWVPAYSPTYSLFDLGKRVVTILARKVKALTSRREDASAVLAQRIGRTTSETAGIIPDVAKIVGGMATLQDGPAAELRIDEVFGAVFDSDDKIERFEKHHSFDFSIEVYSPNHENIHIRNMRLARMYTIKKDEWGWVLKFNDQPYGGSWDDGRGFSSLDGVKDLLASHLDRCHFSHRETLRFVSNST